MRRSMHSTLLALPLLACAAILALVPRAGGQPALRHVAAQTAYLHEAIEGFRTITIEGDLGGNGTLTLDPNACTLNAFGDIEACTLLPPARRSVSLKRVAVPDPAGRGRTLYTIDGAGLGTPLALVVHPDPARPLRLVYGDKGPGTPRAVTLEPLAASPP